MLPIASERARAPLDFRVDEQSALDFRFALREVQSGLQHALDARLAPHGLTAVQGMVLDALRRMPGANLAEVGAVLRVDAAAMSRHAARLEARGLCVRFRPRGDRRAVRVELLPAGIELAAEFPPLLAEVTELALAGFDAAERSLLLGALQRMLLAPALDD